MVCSTDGEVTDLAMSATYTESNPEVCLNIFVMRTVFLKRIIEENKVTDNLTQK